jgi:hypothetical protein
MINHPGKMRKATYLFILFFFAVAACKKNGNSSDNCKVASLVMLPTGGSPQAVQFTWGDDGKLKFMNNSSNVVEYTHYANGYKRRSSLGNGWSVNSFIELNASGLPITKKDTTFNGQIVSNTTITSFEYNNQSELLNTYKDNSSTPLEMFTWSGGNLVKYQSGNNSYFLEYYTDKKNRDFTFIDLQLFVALGTNPAKSKNLLKSLTSGGNQLVFQYQYDGKGNITKWYANLLGNSDTAITTTQQIMCN